MKDQEGREREEGREEGRRNLTNNQCQRHERANETKAFTIEPDWLKPVICSRLWVWRSRGGEIPYGVL